MNAHRNKTSEQVRSDREQQSTIGAAATHSFQHRNGCQRAAATTALDGTCRLPKHAEFRGGAPANPIESDAPAPIRQVSLGKLPRPLENLPCFAWKIEFHLSPPSINPGVGPAAR
jgi:hypothetical protein